MSTDKKYKKDKEIVFELETQIKDIRHQLNEQLRCLEIRLENHNGMTWELMDFYQRRAEVEYEYSRSLDKLVKSIVAKHKTEKQKRDPWQAYSTYKMWQTLLGITTKQSKNHSLLADAFNSVIMGKFSQMRDDMVRVYRKCHDMAINLHSELVRAVTELHSFMKTYHLYNGECKQSETKLHRAETQKSKVEQEKKGTLTKRFQNYDKKTEKHRTRVLENNLKALKARNEYLLSVDSANGAIRKFFVDDMPDLINAMDYGYHISLGQIMMYNVEMEEKVGRLEQEGLTLLTNKAKELNQITDRQAFLQQYHQIFSLPKKFEFQPHKGDNVSEVMCPASVREDMMSRVKTITERLHALKLENDEYWKTLETTDNALVERLTLKDFDVNMQFQQGEKVKEKLPTKSTSSDFEKQRAEFIETQNFYLNKFKSYQLNSNLIARLLSKCSAMEKATAGIKSGATR
jgi:SLIT-ROBO Rho GTPase activating protein